MLAFQRLGSLVDVLQGPRCGIIYGVNKFKCTRFAVLYLVIGAIENLKGQMAGVKLGASMNFEVSRGNVFRLVQRIFRRYFGRYSTRLLRCFIIQ